MVTGTGSGTGTGWHSSNPPSLSPSTLLPPFSPELASLLAQQAAQLAAQQTQQTLNLTSTLQLAALNTAPVLTHDPRRHPAAAATGAWARARAGTGPAAGNPFLPPGIDRRIIDIPPPNETRLKTDEVMVQIRSDIARGAPARRGRQSRRDAARL